HARIEPWPPLSELQCALRARDVPAGDQQPLDAGQPRRPDHELDVMREPVRVQVGMRIDEPHGIDGATPTPVPRGAPTSARRNAPWSHRAAAGTDDHRAWLPPSVG